MNPGDLRTALAAAVPDLTWLDDALRRVRREPTEVSSLVAVAGRHCGRSTPLAMAGWTAQDAARVLLLAALPLRGVQLGDQIAACYRYGDAAGKRAVLRALPMLALGAAAVDLLHDAIRTNDTRLVAEALGPYAMYLDDATWRQAVLKCVFMGVPLDHVHRLNERADRELARMLAALAEERRAAGRAVPADATALMDLLGA